MAFRPALRPSARQRSPGPGIALTTIAGRDPRPSASFCQEYFRPEVPIRMEWRGKIESDAVLHDRIGLRISDLSMECSSVFSGLVAFFGLQHECRWASPRKLA